MIINIRPHHLLCMQGYQGKGYNEDFVKNMDRIVHSFRDSPKGKVRVVRGCDDICVACPFKDGGKCSKLEKSGLPRLEKEANIVKVLGLEYGGVYEVGYLFEVVNEKIKSRGQAEEIYCGGCQWHEVCLWYQCLVDSGQ